MAEPPTQRARRTQEACCDYTRYSTCSIALGSSCQNKGCDGKTGDPEEGGITTFFHQGQNQALALTSPSLVAAAHAPPTGEMGTGEHLDVEGEEGERMVGLQQSAVGDETVFCPNQPSQQHSRHSLRTTEGQPSN
eukprot:15324483-Ditylum_brightwellii.AAC.1